MNSANTLLFVMSVAVLNVASNEEIDDIIADAVQETYKEPLRKACTRDELGSSFAFLQQQRDDEDEIARRGYKYALLIRNLITRSGMSIADLQANDDYQSSFNEQLCAETLPSCDLYRKSPYRSATGMCNNLQKTTWGMALQAHARYLPAVYDDGYNSPRQRGQNGDPLPSPRVISNQVLSGESVTPADNQRNLILFTYGQFIDHDLTFTPIAVGSDGSHLECCGKDQSDSECLGIEIPAGDTRFSSTCMDFSRSIPVAFNGGCSIGYREQLNRLSSYIDGGMIYGDSKSFNENLSGKLGLLRTSDGELLPSGGICQTSDSADFCQLAGDERVNEAPSLSGLHVVFLRLHNMIARGIRKETKYSSQEVFLETKKIVGAIIQQVTYGEYLPVLLGKKIRKNLGLDLHSRGYWRGYDPNVNPTVKNVIATAALRYGHSQIPPEFGYKTREFATTATFKTEDVLMDPHMVVTQQGSNIPDLARFLLTTPARKVDRQVEDAVRNELFRDANGLTFDLMSFNIQRGRDHALPSYNAWRKWCGLPVAGSFSELVDHNDDAKSRLENTYEHVNDIDVFVGGITETPRDDALVGPLFECLLGRQFRDIKCGDRYWYERRGVEGFRTGELQEIRKLTLSKILCETLGLEEIQKDVFSLPDEQSNPLVSCSSLPFLNFSRWRRSRSWPPYGKPVGRKPRPKGILSQLISKYRVTLIG
uniref:Myeloperoxidase-like n=1 Tax=Crassostrea virginica TaxID=6565 RepID=A0A8B8AGT9_CRAVI|nr:myeloperoxidase-like [Crassostrea virginica]